MSLLFKGLLEFIIRQLTFKILFFVVMPLCVIALVLFGRSTPNDDERGSLAQVDTVDSGASLQAAQQVIIVDEDGTVVNAEVNAADDSTSEAQSVLAPQMEVKLNDTLAASASQDGSRSSLLEPQVTILEPTTSLGTQTELDPLTVDQLELDQLELDRLELDRLVIPAIDLDIPVTELGWHPATSETGQIFSEWDVAINAAGWHKNSARPGEGGNVVMSGHNNIYGAVFRELDQLDQGDEAFVYVGDRLYTYEISQVMVVPEVYADADQRAENAQWIEYFDDDRITLVSCWPRDDNSHRIIVIGYAVEG